MILVLDTYYYEELAYCVGFLFSWNDEEPQEIFETKYKVNEAYVPGEFYKRELPGLLKVIEQVDLNKVECIVIDGYVELNHGRAGLGAHLYNALNLKVPVIGVAKNEYHAKSLNTQTILRGKSTKPLFITCIGMSLSQAARLIEKMPGEYRIPTILKKLDQKTKSS